VKTWRRWFRRKLRELLGEPGPIVSACVAIFLGLVTIDAVTKQFGEIGLHPGNVKNSTILLALPFLVWRITRLPATVAMAGYFGNALWTMNPGGVPNVLQGPGFQYNLADVFIIVGGYATVLAIVMHFVVVGYRCVS
jgi:hypothetical protein